MIIDLVVQDERWAALNLQSLAETVAQAMLPAGDWEISILACNDARIAGLNADFRGRPQPTNVLSWPSEERSAPTPGQLPAKPRDAELGDVAIAWETCQREALEQGKPFDHHVTHLLVHSILHLLGYDHIRDEDATLMERIEVETLGKLGIPDPY